MSNNKDIVVNPWLKGVDRTADLPGDALFVCTYELHIGVDVIEEAAFFRRTDTTDELWIIEGSSLPDMRLMAGRVATLNSIAKSGHWMTGCVFVVQKSNDEFSASLGLLDRLFRARVHFYRPGKLISAGVINEPAYNALVWNIEHEMEENAGKAQEEETEIVRVARELGLSPQPSGTGPDQWLARCPEKNHHLYIKAETNSFGCGWCKRSGSAGDLQAFVKERKQRKQE